MGKKTSKHKSRRFGRICRFLRAEEGVSALEYAILVGVIAAAVGGAILAFGGNITTAIGNLGADINAVTGAGTPPTTPPAP